MNLNELPTPCLLLDEPTLERNLARLRERLARHGVRLRPHVKTAKCREVIARVGRPGEIGLTVSTLAEAEQCLAAGYTDLVYAVGIAPGKLEEVAALRRRGADLVVLLDSMEAARAVADRGARESTPIPALVEIDCDGQRAGIVPDDPDLLAIGRALHDSAGAALRGVLTHGGGSYGCRSVAAIREMAARERSAVVAARDRLVDAGLPCPVVSVGSTPTATFGESFSGVTEVRAGVYMFQDLVMAGLGVCTLDDIALSVLVAVIGHQAERGWLVTDGGFTALSRDRGTATHAIDQGLGVVCDLDGRPFPDLDLLVVATSQEHGIVARRDRQPFDLTRFPLGTRLRVLPNHACATAAQHSCYHVVRGGREVTAVWERFGGW